MKKACAVAGLFAGISISAAASAGVCTSLNDRFSARAELNFDQLTTLRAEYKALYDSAPAGDKLECATYLGRIDILRGGLLPEFPNADISVEKQKAALDDCLNVAGDLKEGNTAEYHYFYTACLGFRGKLEGLMGRIQYGLMARAAKGPALEVARSGGNFEAGGIYRVMSALAGNRLAKPLGLYDSEEALQYANFALATPSRSLPPFSSPLSGQEFFENHFYKAQSTIAYGIDQNNKDTVIEGNQMLTDNIDEIDFLREVEELGERKIETLAYQQMMIKLKAKADACLATSDWNQCLIDRLSE